MARSIGWSFKEKGGLRDYWGIIEPFRMFTLAQMADGKGVPLKKWELTVHYLPSQMNKKVYTDVELAQRTCQQIVERFARWIGGETTESPAQDRGAAPDGAHHDVRPQQQAAP